MDSVGSGRGRWHRDAIGFTPGDGGGEGDATPDDGWTEPSGAPEPGWPDPGDGASGPVEAFPGETESPSRPFDDEAAGPIAVDVFIYVWITQTDGRVCPVCGPLHGTRWEDDDGPFPPLHVGCRCERRLLTVERRTARGGE